MNSIEPLDIPDGFLQLTDEQKKRICNGAGAADGIKVPNTMYGLNMIECFDMHDYEYEVGQTRAEKRRADRRMLVNLVIKINNKGGLLKWLRLRRAMSYFIAVSDFGDKAFFKGK